MTDKSRMAEIVTELMGARGVADLVRDLLDNASPEVKREIADAVFARLKAEITDHPDIRREISGQALGLMRVMLAPAYERLTADVEVRAVVDRVAAGIPARIEAAAEEMARATVRRVQEHMPEILRDVLLRR